MNKIKKIIKNPGFWIISVLIIFGILLFLFLSKKEIYGYLLFSDISSYKCTKKECILIENEKIDEDTKKGNFYFYENFENKGQYRIDYINRWNFFDSNNNWVNLSSSFIAGNEPLSLEVKEYKTRTMDKEELVLLEKYLKENNVSFYTNLIQNEVLEYDFNKNGKEEKIILASNANDETMDEKIFSIVIAVVNNKSSILYLDINSQGEYYDVPSYRIKGIINLFQHKEDYLVLLKGYFSEVGVPTNYLYKVEKNNFHNLVNSK